MGGYRRSAASVDLRAGRRWFNGQACWLAAVFAATVLGSAGLWPANAGDDFVLGAEREALQAAAASSDPTVDALVDYARSLQLSGAAATEATPVPRGHGLSSAAAAAHAGMMAHGLVPSQRFMTQFVGHAHARPSLKLPELSGGRSFEITLQLAASASLATAAEARLLRHYDTRRTMAAVRSPDFAVQMPQPRSDEMVRNWVAIENLDEMLDEPRQFDFVQILSARTDEWKPILIAAQRQPQPGAGGRAPMVAPAPGDPDGRYFVGSKPCETCHAGLFDEFQQTVMGRNIKSGKITPQGKMECETCHGPGSAHVNGGGGREKGGIRSFRPTDTRGFDVAEANGVCLSCHEKGDQTYWQGSPHETRGLACVSCHTVMRKTSPRNQLKTPLVMDTCFQCHKDRKAQVQRTSHMPIRENKITCASCHNPHGSPTDKLLREATVNDVCYTCHADKRGPFLFEHPPVRENCLNCHEPHGSNHEALLVVARPRLCQQCHTNPHNQPGLGAATMRYQVGNACQNCHTNIHGSNSPSGSRWHR